MQKIKNLISFLFLNFGPLIGFYLVNYFWGFEAGIMTSIVLVFIEFFYLKIQKRKISSFFYFSSGIIVIFGVVDLTIQGLFLIKYEAFVTNLIFSIFFGLSLFKERPIVQEIAESQKRTSTDTSLDKTFFFQFITFLWCAYFLLKAIFYLWLNHNASLNEALVVRMIVGKVSFWIMMFISVAIPKQIWKGMELLGLFPSQRTNIKII